MAITFSDLTGVLAHLSGKTNGRAFPVGDAKVLTFLAIHGPSVIGDICHGTRVGPSNMTRIVERLELRGLVRRKIGDDKRQWVITPTIKGIEAAKSLLE